MSTTATLPSSPSSTLRSYTRPRSTTLMPSSGSTTSRIASSRSARNSSLGTAVSLIWRLLTSLGNSVFEGHPAQQRTLDASRILGHPGESDAVTEHVLVTLDVAAGRNHFVERRDGLQRVADSLADQQIGEHGGGGLADRAALPVVGDVGDRLTVLAQRHPQCHLVAAGRVDVVHFGAERLPQPAAVRMLVVVQD